MIRLQAACAAVLAAFATHAAAVGGLVDLAVVDRTEGRTLPVYWHEGRAYIAGKPGNEYQLVLRSRSGEDLLTVASVDGVNVITGETASPRQSGYVVSPWRTQEIRGWRKDLSRTAAFYFTALPDSYAARTGRPDNVGAIGIAVFRRKAQEPQPALSQPFSQAGATCEVCSQAREKSAAADAASAPARAAEAPLGTGHGRSEASYARRVEFERASSEPAETIVLYYDSVRNLVARGIVPAPRPARPAPNPFPGFVPDPPA